MSPPSTFLRASKSTKLLLSPMSQFLYHVKIPSLSSLYVEDGRLPDVGKDYTNIARPRRHLWSREEKRILHILDKYYKNNTADIWKVFSHYFADRFSRLPKPRRKSFESMRSYNRHPLRYHVGWTIPTTKRLQARLEQEASTIGINLQAVARTNFEVSTLTFRKRRRAPSPSVTSDSSGADWDSDQFETNEDIRRTCRIRKPYDTSQTPRAHAHEASRQNGLLTPPSSGKENRQISIDTPVPPIAFRAGSFVGLDLTTLPAPPDKQLYLRDLERHLGRKHSGATPFISVSQNLLRVFVHALRRSRQAGKEGKTAWNIAVVNLSRISSSVKAVWDLDAGVHSRRAFGEWVVYGAIPSSNVLCVVSVDKLLHLLSQVPAPFYVEIIKKAKNTRSARKAMASAVNRTLTHDDGVTFGHFLLSLGIPKRYLEYVCTTILADWRFPEHRTWLSNKEFVQGLSEAYQQTPQGFSVIPAAVEHDVGTLASSNEWLSDFLVEVEETAFGTKRDNHTKPHEPGWKKDSHGTWFQT
ncbi:MAG: hypothetical protein Q9211_003725 [Gyalolechia sp. 1 TL-2023]